MSSQRYLSPSERRDLLEQLSIAEDFEHFFHVKYRNIKRFSLEGSESLILALETILKKSRDLGVQEIILGMSHRGRLNVLTNVLKTPLEFIFSKFQECSGKASFSSEGGDVTYHLGASSERREGSHSLGLSLTSNPSHLEAVDPVVLGQVRGRQFLLNDQKRAHVMGLLLHGDAAFTAQGIVSETFELSQLEGYKTGGTLHIIINNQIGFTTDPSPKSSSFYCSDKGKLIQAPIFHVNADDVESVVYVAALAAEFRATFKKDVVIRLLSKLSF